MLEALLIDEQYVLKLDVINLPEESGLMSEETRYFRSASTSVV